MQIALVHDWLLTLGGAERVLIELHKIFPEAPIYTLFSDRTFIQKHIPDAKIINSHLQKFPFIKRAYPYLLPLMPLAVESFNLSEFDTVISSSVTFSKGLVLKPKTRHICYCYSPTRWLWDRHSDYERRGIAARLAQHFFRIWDRQAADRVDEFVAISKHVRQRIKKYYHRDAKVIYPPMVLDISEKKDNPTDEGYFLLVSRLHKFKNIDVAIKAFNKLKHRLLIVGDGPEKKQLRKIAEGNITFMGEVTDTELIKHYASAKAIIMPQEEDFGLIPVEAMHFGKPTLALRRGGALETVAEGITGEFFDDPIPEALAEGVGRLKNYDPKKIIKKAQQYSAEQFREKIKQLIDSAPGRP